MTDSSPLLRMTDVRKVFVTDELETHALFDVNLEIEPGAFVAVEGPSGSGKSTLLSLLGLLDVPSAGRYELEGVEASSLGAAARARLRNRKIGFIFQSFNLIGELNVYENVELPLCYRGLGAAERKKRAEQALERVAMAHRMRHLPQQLSGGQQQRVAVARAIAGDPAVLLADEPTGNLDSLNGERVMELLAELHRGGSTIVMVTHNPEYVRYATTVVRLHDGRLVDERRAA